MKYKLENMPEGWTCTEYPIGYQFEDAQGRAVHFQPKPYDPMPLKELLDKALKAALDPCLRNGWGKERAEQSHCFNGWQLHYKR